MITIKWNYKGWVEHPYPDWTQDMWNQMLFTKINEASARIHMKKLLSPATHIKIHRSHYIFIFSIFFLNIFCILLKIQKNGIKNKVIS